MMSEGDGAEMRWAEYEHQQRQVAARRTHRVRFVGGPHDQRVEYLPSMPPPEHALPPVGVEVGYDLHHWDNPRPPDAGPEWVSPTYVHQGVYRRDGLRYDPAESLSSETWTYRWEPAASGAERSR